MQESSKKAISNGNKHIINIMKMIYWMAKEDIPISKFPSLINLGHALQVPDLFSLNNTITYENNKSGQELLKSISESIELVI